MNYKKIDTSCRCKKYACINLRTTSRIANFEQKMIFFEMKNFKCFLILPLLLFVSILDCSQAQQIPEMSNSVFGPVKHYRSGRENVAVAVVDMNRDGKPDIVSASRSDGKITIHYNDKEGNFDSKRDLRCQDSHHSLVSLDANGDGWPDIATLTEKGRLCVLLNDGNGFLARPRVYFSGNFGFDLLACDIDLDGDPDLCAIAHRDETINIHINNGKGIFKKQHSIKTGAEPRSLAIGDLDGDGELDAVVGGDRAYLYFHKGKGFGVFEEKYRSIPSTMGSWGLALADFNGDKRLDIAVSSYYKKELSIHLSGEHELNASHQILVSGDHNFDLFIADIDKDKDPDIVTVSRVDNAINLHLNQGDGTFSDFIHRSTGIGSVAIGGGDLDGDGDIDIVTGSKEDGNVNVHRNFIMEQNVVQRRALLFVKGKVFDIDQDSLVLPRVSVSLRNSRDEGVDATFTDENGYFEFVVDPNTSYFLVARTKDFPPGRVAFEMPEQQYQQNIYLQSIKETYLKGKVIDARSQMPVEEASLTLVDPEGKASEEKRSNVNGNFGYQSLKIGYNYEVQVKADGYDLHSAYFDIEKSDIGRGVELLIELDREPTGRCVSGQVTDEQSGLPLPKAGLIIKDSLGRTRAKFRASEEGTYRKCLPYGTFEVTAIAKGYFYKVSSFDLPKDELRADFEYNLSLKPLEKDSSILLNVYFDKDRHEIKEEYFPELRRAIEIMEQNPSLIMEIAGHTSSEGSAEYNKRLSQERADEVVRYMVEKGIYPDRLRARGYGEEVLVINPDDTPEKREKNRRTEFRVLQTSK